MKLIIGTILLAVCGMSADAPKPVPQITADQRAKFWRSQAEVISAQSQAERAKAAFEASVEALKKACGDQQLSIGQDGEPTCTPKLEPPKEAAK